VTSLCAMTFTIASTGVYTFSSRSAIHLAEATHANAAPPTRPAYDLYFSGPFSTLTERGRFFELNNRISCVVGRNQPIRTGVVRYSPVLCESVEIAIRIPAAIRYGIEQARRAGWEQPACSTVSRCQFC